MPGLHLPPAFPQSRYWYLCPPGGSHWEWGALPLLLQASSRVPTSARLPMTLLFIPTSTAEVQARSVLPSPAGSALGSFPHAAGSRGIFVDRRSDPITPILAVCAQSFHSCLTVGHHGIFQARILEWVAIPSSRESFQLRDWTLISCIAGGFFTDEPPGKTLSFIKLQIVPFCPQAQLSKFYDLELQEDIYFTCS